MTTWTNYARSQGAGTTTWNYPPVPGLQSGRAARILALINYSYTAAGKPAGP
jgi:hypothetical protein